MPAAATSVHFADTALRLADACRRLGLVPPGFRSPPADPRFDRTLRRRPDGAAIVAVRLHGRPLATVMTDMVDGVIAANRLTGPGAGVARRQLLADLGVPSAACAA